MAWRDNCQDQSNSKKSFFVGDLNDFNTWTKSVDVNPLEKTMGMILLAESIPYYTQQRVDLLDGWICDGRKYFIADFVIDTIDLDNPYYDSHGKKDGMKFCNGKFIIETEGKIHQTILDEDRHRFNFLSSLGFRWLRFGWDDVMNNSTLITNIITGLISSMQEDIIETLGPAECEIKSLLAQKNELWEENSKLKDELEMKEVK